MSEIKETGKLIDELQGAASFEEYASSNKDAFTASECPHCGAPLQAGASYCTSCMTLLREREVISLKKPLLRNRGKIVAAVLALLAVSVLVFFGIKALTAKKESVGMPSPVEYQALLVGTLDENTRLLWHPERLSPKGTSDGFQLFETDTPMSEAPVLIAFSEDGKCLWFALQDVPSYASSSAVPVLENAFSALYRRKVENLEEILSSGEYFQRIEAPNAAFSAFLSASGIEPADEAVIEKSLPIKPGSYQSAPEAAIYQVRSAGKYSYFVVFGSEAP